MKKFLKSCITYLSALGICLCIAAICAIVIIKNTVFSEGFMLESYNKSEYYSFVKGEIIEAYDTYGYASGLPAEFFDDNVVNVMWVYEDINAWTESAYKGENFAVDKEKLYADLEKKVYLYAEEAMIEVDEEAKEGVANFVSECVKSYEKRIGFPLLKDLGAFKIRYDGLMTWAIVLLVLAALGLCFLLKRQEKLYSAVFSRVSSAFFGSSLVFAVPSALILLSGVVMRIGIANRSFYYFLTTYATIFFSYVLVSGLILISLGIFFGLLSWRLQGDARKRIEAKGKSE